MKLKPTAFLFCTVALTCSAFADATSDARTQIQKAYQASSAAMTRKDPKALVAQMAPNYRRVYKGKTTTRAMAAQQAATILTLAQSVKAQSTITKFALVKGKAIATVHETGEMIFVNPQTKQKLKVATDSTGEDTWISTRGVWLVEQSKTLTSTITANGKKVQM